MEKLTQRIVDGFISMMFAFALFMISQAIIDKKNDSSSIVKRVEIIEKKKAEKEDVIKAKEASFAYTDKEINEVKRDLTSGVATLNKRIDDVISNQKQTNDLLRELIKSSK